MTTIDVPNPSRLTVPAAWRVDLAVAALAALIVLCVQAYSGFETLSTSQGDNDSLLRLVEVRDLIAGQGWFDLHQYRMGPDGGVPMHWSRIVDLPIALIVLAVSTVAGSQATGETAAMLIWPLSLYASAFFLLLRIARRLAGEEVMLPTAVIGGIGLYFTGIFMPGGLDHHNIQLVLTLAMMLCLLKAEPGNYAGYGAGVLAVLMLAVGMETAPFVAVGGLVVAAWFLVEGAKVRGVAAGFGIAFATLSAVMFVATVPPADWAVARCDSFSITQSALGVLAGCGLAMIALAPALSRTWKTRAISLVALGIMTAAAVVIFFPQCLADPYVALDPNLRRHWISAISEAQPLWQILSKEPETASGHYLTPLIALVVIGWRLRRNGLKREEVIVAAFLVAAMLVSIWQIRGSRFSIPLASLPLAVWVSEFRRRSQEKPGTTTTLKLIGSWLASLNIVWIMVTIVVSLPFTTAGADEDAAAQSVKRCERKEDYAALAAMPATTVLAVSNLGAPILAETHHRSLAGPIHRNVDGNRQTLEAFMGSDQDAARVVHDNHVGLIVVCRGNGETELVTGWAPAGFMSALLRNDVPIWLEKLPQIAGTPLEIYRVRAAL